MYAVPCRVPCNANKRSKIHREILTPLPSPKHPSNTPLPLRRNAQNSKFRLGKPLPSLNTLQNPEPVSKNGNTMSSTHNLTNQHQQL